MNASFLPPPQHVAGTRTNTKKTISNNHWPLPRSPQPPVARPEKHALRTLRRDRGGERVLALDGAQDPVFAAPLVNICAYGTLINELQRRHLLILNFLMTIEMSCSALLAELPGNQAPSKALTPLCSAERSPLGRSSGGPVCGRSAYGVHAKRSICPFWRSTQQ